MTEVAKTDFYELAIDNSKNRIKWTIKGFWKNVDVVPNFDADWKKTTAKTQKGFTILADLTTMKPFPPDVAKLNEVKQQELMQLGCKKVAQVNYNPTAVMQINRVAKESGMNSILQAFENFKDAENWLDK